MLLLFLSSCNKESRVPENALEPTTTTIYCNPSAQKAINAVKTHPRIIGIQQSLGTVTIQWSATFVPSTIGASSPPNLY